jgi:hypothetical protein
MTRRLVKDIDRSGAARQPQLAGEPVDLRLAWKGEGEPVSSAGRGTVHEDLVAVELLGDLGVDDGPDDKYADPFVGVVLQVVRAAPTYRTRDDLTGLELAGAVKRSKRRPPGQHDDHFLVAVVERVQWPDPTFRNFVAVALLALLASRPHAHAHKQRRRDRS